jgi:DNA-binding PadR family transcriptional regulator
MAASAFVDELRKRVIQNFMDIFILTEMRKNSLSGYDAINLIHKKYGMLMSSGTVYSLLYSLERDGWIKGIMNHRKRVYVLTERGEQEIKTIARASAEVQDFLRSISVLNGTAIKQLQTAP